MRLSRLFLVLAACASLGIVWGQTAGEATFGSVVTPITQGGVNYLVGGATDIALDEQRSRLYLVNSGQRRIEVYSIPQRRFLSTVQTDLLPLSAAISRNNRFLYVACHDGSALNVIDLETMAVSRRVSLPAKPEGVAVGADETVLITTIGTGNNNQADTLLVFDPRPEAVASPIRNVIFTPPPPPSPVLPPPAGRPAFATRTNLAASRDGRLIFGFNAINATQRALFVYEVASASILRSRTVNESSSVLSVAPDGSKFMAGLRLFDTETLQVIAQQNAANLPYTLPNNSNFNIQQNQGGSAFSPDGRTLYTAFNFAPLQNPPARANISQLLLNDPDNLLTSLGLKLPENLSGNMVISSDGSTIYAISESGFMILPVSRISDSPIAIPASTSVLLATDQCGATAALRSGIVEVRNAGSGRITATAQLVPNTGGGNNPVIIGPPGVGPGGPGGGQPGGGIIIVLPPVNPGQPGGTTTPQQTQTATAPTTRPTQAGGNPAIEFGFNSVNARTTGTITPHDFLVVSPQAVNIPPQVRIYQNTRDTEARADVAVIPRGISGNEGLVDMVTDTARQRLYIANSGLNRVEVFDMRRKAFLPSIKVGQLPRSLALTPDGSTLYVANSGGESISIIDAERLVVTGRVKFPALPFNSTAAIVTPSVIAATQRGVQIVMNNGTLWKLDKDEAIPRPTSSILGTATIPAPRTMAVTPNGEFAILLGGTGTVYLYDALSDEYVASRSIQTQITGYYGPLTAGPGGNYYVVNGIVLNSSLVPQRDAGTVTVPGQGGGTFSRPIAAVTSIGATAYARFSPGVRTNANAVPVGNPMVEIVNVADGTVRSSSAGLEGPLSNLIANARVNIDGRTMAIDALATTAYILTTSGLSVVPLDTPAAGSRPSVNNNGVVNSGSYTSSVAPNGLVSIFGNNLGRRENASTTPLPQTLGGMCVTLNNTALPLFFTSPNQINAQIPPDLAAGRYPLVVRSIDSKVSSLTTQVTVARYAPAVLVDDRGQPQIYRVDRDTGQAYEQVTRDSPTTRDERLVLYALGLGLKSTAPTGPRPGMGIPVPAAPLIETDKVQVFFDDPTIAESEVIVEWSGLVPGFVGLYQINLYVPWNRRRGDSLPVTIRVGGVESPRNGPVPPMISVR